MKGVWVVFIMTPHYDGNIIHSVHRTEKQAVKTKNDYIVKSIENDFGLEDETIEVNFYEYGDWCVNADLKDK